MVMMGDNMDDEDIDYVEADEKCDFCGYCYEDCDCSDYQTLEEEFFMNEQQFIQKLIKNGWSEEDAKREAHQQFREDEGDCDGDLDEIEQIAYLQMLNSKIQYHGIMETEVTVDCYCGETCDQLEKQFTTFCDGDRDSENHKDDITISLNDLPPGARITVEYPCCPSCGMPREDKVEFSEDRIYRIVGHEQYCSGCGFNWEHWVLNKYS